MMVMMRRMRIDVYQNMTMMMRMMLMMTLMMMMMMMRIDVYQMVSGSISYQPNDSIVEF